MRQNLVISPCAGKEFCPAFPKPVWVVLKKIVKQRIISEEFEVKKHFFVSHTYNNKSGMA